MLQGGVGCAAALAFGANTLRAFSETPVTETGAFTPLLLGEIFPSGWLQRQLQLQADGMGGHLDEFWPDVGNNSGWVGGTGESWERGPYFVDGLFPLAVQLKDTRLRAKAMRFIDWTLDHQQPNGMIGPASNDDWWPRMVMLKVLAQYYDATNDPRVLPFMTKYFHYQLTALPMRPLSSWGKYRWQDEALVVIWLHRRTGDPELLRLYALLQEQGYDWIEQFRAFAYKEPATKAFLKLGETSGVNDTAMQTHGVNNGQALKTAAVRFGVNHDPAERANFNRQLAQLDLYHGMPNGMFSCDEHLAGLDPSHGSELCTVVETMFSLEVALAAFGDAKLADRLEKIAFNALPGTFSDDMWAHQYDQQPNQIRVSLNSKPWTTNGPESNLYGLEPNFGCCTANFHQGWPKLTQHLWMRSPEGGLAAIVYAPCIVETKVRDRKVKLTVDTEYPFRNTVNIRLMTEKPHAFPLSLRIPGWSRHTRVLVNQEDIGLETKPGTFLSLDRVWRSGDEVQLHFEMQPFLTRGFHSSVTLHRGPLVFSHSPGESWVKLRARGPTADWQVFATKPWNYALGVDESSVAKLEVIEQPVGDRPFAAKGAGTTLRVPARQLSKWTDVDGVAQPLPQSPVQSSAEVEVLELIPYAAAKLRITAFPQCV